MFYSSLFIALAKPNISQTILLETRNKLLLLELSDTGIFYYMFSGFHQQCKQTVAPNFSEKNNTASHNITHKKFGRLDIAYLVVYSGSAYPFDEI